ncbi:hypothetical protein EB354_11180 [Chryseobacterium balustinum]|uniref:Uncharacterized protein n=1 Tax=Chryseobacterium balustinum TaxID=246 RepID=A0AAX2IL23_9FLAO|nr:hypothetical protein EB354_11180 [Chryseobacterium balustinum]SKC12675.1 hypothetical protein SAMN05421800_1412 [Chryseobacterium balustinum]SQA90136.1 Uncharacterised protein [Chryseobacterium balustinum]
MIIVNNKKKATRLMNFLFASILLIFCTILIGFVFKDLIKYYLRWPVLLAMISFIIIMFNWIRELRVFQFENIGSTFTIKYYHPLNKGIIFPYVEFPIKNVTRFKIEKRILKPDLMKFDILVNEKNKIVRFRLRVVGLNRNAYFKIENSLKP